MEEQLYGVRLVGIKNYNGRDPEGRIKLTVAGAGVLMTLDCATALVKKLKSKYRDAEVVNLWRDGRDDLTATCLKELGEDPRDELEKAMKDALAAGLQPIEVHKMCSRVAPLNLPRLEKAA